MYVEMLGIAKQGTATQSVMCQHCDRPHTLKISRTINFLYAFYLAIFLSVNISVTLVENGLLIIPIYFVIEAQIHTNSYTLQQRQITVISSQITGRQTVCSTFSSDNQHTNIKGPYYRPFVKGIYRWRVDSSHKGTVTQNTFPFDGVIK